MSDLLADYLSCWNETDAQQRRTLIERHFVPNVTYSDPMAVAHGIDELDATIGGVQAQFPDFVFSAAGAVDAHHDQARFSWNLGPRDAEPVVIGSDVVTLDDDGRIVMVLGFLDRVPT